jgi:hypothetical protein
MKKTDIEAYAAYPTDRHLYNKLALSRILGYRCGTGVIPCSGTWVVRPIINLEGMGLDAVIQHYEAGDRIPEGMFYSEVFTGRHITIDYVREGGVWMQTHTFEGFNTPDNLIQFSRWTRVFYPYRLPILLQSVQANHINIEIIGGKIIEVHLRGNSDPVMYEDFWPIWSERQPRPKMSYVRIPDKEDHIGRLGFYVPGCEW